MEDEVNKSEQAFSASFWCFAVLRISETFLYKLKMLISRSVWTSSPSSYLSLKQST